VARISTSIGSAGPLVPSSPSHTSSMARARSSQCRRPRQIRAWSLRRCRCRNRTTAMPPSVKSASAWTRRSPRSGGLPN